MALILKGSQVAAAMSEELSRRAASLAAEDVRPTLAILRVGERADDIAYENAAVKRCLAVGVDVIQHHLPQNAPREKLLTEIDAAGKTAASTVFYCSVRLRTQMRRTPPAPRFRRKRTLTA